MQVDKCSKTQSFKADDIEALDEMLDEWCERNNKIITNIALVFIPAKEITIPGGSGLTTTRKEILCAIVTYNIKESIVKPNDL